MKYFFNIFLVLIVGLALTLSININAKNKYVVLICSYNNEDWISKNLDSIYSQTYKDFRVIYVDDCSTDNTVEKIESYIRDHNLNNFKLLKNSQQKLKLDNLYHTIHNHCQDNEIVIQIDGDDWLLHENVFEEINTAFSDNNIWIVWCKLINYPSNTIGFSRDIVSIVPKYNSFRENNFVYGNPRCFYTWLFKLIKKRDLISNSIPGFGGKFYPYSDDVATMIPMLEMAGDRIKFIDNPAYAYNLSNSLSWTNSSYKKSISQMIARELRMKNKYRKLKSI